MNHHELNTETLRAHMDGQIAGDRASAVSQHIDSCTQCRAELKILKGNAATVRAGLDRLPNFLSVSDAESTSVAWSSFQGRRDPVNEKAQAKWSAWRVWTLAGEGLVVVGLLAVLLVAPIRSWAEQLLSIFRVEHFTVLEINAANMKGTQDSQVLNQAVSRVMSNDVSVTQARQEPRLIADAGTATKLTGFPVRLLADQTPSALFFESGEGAQMRLDRDRLQSILDEAGRGDLQIPDSVDGAIVGIRIPAGILALYGDCGNRAARIQGQVQANGQVEEGDATCVSLLELPSPEVSAPQQLNPGPIAQVALQFLGMSPNDAANFTQTVDWTTTLVLPVARGESTYEQLPVNGNEGVLLRGKGPKASPGYTLMWVDNGIVYCLNGTGDDTTALSVASQLE